MQLDTYSFLDSNNKVTDVCVFEKTHTEQDLENSKSLLNAQKYIKVEDHKYYGVGNFWSDEHQKFYPVNEFKNMIWDFEVEQFVPAITKPNNDDISLGDWIWDYEKGEWYFITPIPEIPEGKPNKWIWDKTNSEWIWDD